MSKIVVTTQDARFVLETDKIVGLYVKQGECGCLLSFKGETGQIDTVRINEPFNWVAKAMDAVPYVIPIDALGANPCSFRN